MHQYAAALSQGACAVAGVPARWDEGAPANERDVYAQRSGRRASPGHHHAGAPVPEHSLVKSSRRRRVGFAAALLVTVAGVAAAAATPAVQVSRGAVAVPRGSTDDVGALEIMTSSAVTYTLANVGDTVLSVIDVGLLAPLNGGCTVTTNPAGTTVAAGGTTTVTIAVRADAPGPAGCTVRIVSDEPQQLYSFTLRGTAAAGGAPEFELTRGAVVLADGDWVSDVPAVAGVEVFETLTVKNRGTAPLLVPVAEITAEMGASCVLASAAAFDVPPGGSVDLRISITRSGAEDLECALHIQSNDADENTTVVRITSRRGGTHFEVYVNDARVQSLSAAELDDPTKAIDPGFQTSHVVRIVNTGAEPLFEYFVDVVDGATPCQASETDPFATRLVFPGGETDYGIVNMFVEARGPLESDLCVIDVVHSEATRQHFYVTIKRPLGAPEPCGCAAGAAGAAWPPLALLAIAIGARRRCYVARSRSATR